MRVDTTLSQLYAPLSVLTRRLLTLLTSIAILFYVYSLLVYGVAALLRTASIITSTQPTNYVKHRLCWLRFGYLKFWLPSVQ
jgi:hypothetical protein